MNTTAYSPEQHVLVLYDGVCGLCNRTVQFLLRHDSHGRFRFAPLQSELARTLILLHGADATRLSTMAVFMPAAGTRGRLYLRSDAVIHALEGIGGGWRLLGRALRVIPRPVRDLGYRFLARFRHRIFGRYDACPLPSPEQRAHFLE